jgi:predicted RecB family nuclease
MKQYKKDAIKHYETMLAWAERQPADEYVHPSNMEEEISTSWTSRYCPYCKFWDGCSSTRHENCELAVIPKNREADIRCCNGLWDVLTIPQTWGEWVVAVKKVLKYIKKYG